MTEWHGMPATELESREGEVPPVPDGKYGAALDATIYARVHFSGNYGADFCQQEQAFDRFEISMSEAQQIAWSTFGLCGHTITYYDANGNVVAQN